MDTCGGQRVTGNNYENEKTKKETEMIGNECWNETREIKMKEKIKTSLFLKSFVYRYVSCVNNGHKQTVMQSNRIEFEFA